MSEIHDLQEEIVSRTLVALVDKIPAALHADMMSLKNNGTLLDNGVLHTLIVKAASAQVRHAD